MPSLRKYNLVCEELVDPPPPAMRPKLERPKIRTVSISGANYNERVTQVKSGLICDVRKSPRAPEYEVFYVQNKKDGVKVKSKVKVPKVPSKGVTHTKYDEEVVETDRVSNTVEEEMVGLRVIACNKHDGLYYPGQVAKSSSTTYAVVTFNFERKQKVSTRNIIPLGGAVPRPELALGDFALVQVYNQFKNIECYVPAIVEFVPEDVRSHSRFYTMLLYNGQRETTLRRNIVKIGRERFEVAVRYIHLIQQNEQARKTLVRNRKSRRASSPISEKSEDTNSVRSERSDSVKSERSDSVRSDRSDSVRSERSHTSMSTNMSTDSKPRRKKEKYTKKLAKKEKDGKEKRPNNRNNRSSSRSKSRSRSRSGSRSGSQTPRARSDHDSGSPTPRQSPIDRPENPVPMPRPQDPIPRHDSMLVTRTDIYLESSDKSNHSNTSQSRNHGDKDQLINDLQYQLEKQQRKQLRQEWRLIKQARKINKIQEKLRYPDYHNESGRSGRAKSITDSEASSHRQSRTEEPKIKEMFPPEDEHKQQHFTSPALERRSPSGLPENIEVLARWSDDGWYYVGLVGEQVSHDRYMIEDSTGHREEIGRQDILTEEEHIGTIQPNDYVIGLHPNFEFSYCPGKVVEAYKDDTCSVKFYDGKESTLTYADMYKISQEKCKKDMEFIIECENRLVGRDVIARDNETGVYKKGEVEHHNSSQRGTYGVRLTNGHQVDQRLNQIFDMRELQRDHHPWQYVLAPIDLDNTQYLPARVIQTVPFTIQQCNKDRSVSVRKDLCFWINKQYYSNAVNFYSNKQQQL